jgi:hypothetical protein
MFVAGMESAKSILEYTNRLMQLPLGIFGQAIGIAVLPTLSQQAAQADMLAFRRTLNYGVRLALFLTVPTSILLIVLARPLIAVVYQRGNFTVADTASAVPALALYAIGVAAWSAQAVVARAFYARGDTWSPVLAGTFVTFCIFVPLNFLLTPLFNVPGTPALTRGPALATSIAADRHLPGARAGRRWADGTGGLVYKCVLASTHGRGLTRGSDRASWRRHCFAGGLPGRCRLAAQRGDGRAARPRPKKGLGLRGTARWIDVARPWFAFKRRTACPASLAPLFASEKRAGPAHRFLSEELEQEGVDTAPNHDSEKQSHGWTGVRPQEVSSNCDAACHTNGGCE